MRSPAESLPDRLISVTMPATAWYCVLANHLAQTVEDVGEERIDYAQAGRCIRQMRILLEAVRLGIPASLDAAADDARKAVEVLSERCGVPDTEKDRQLRKWYTIRHEDLKALIRKLTRDAAANYIKGKIDA